MVSRSGPLDPNIEVSPCATRRCLHAAPTRTTGCLLVVLLVLFVVAPLLPADRAGYGVEFFFDLVLITGAYSAAWQSRHRYPFLMLTLATLAMRWTDMTLDHSAFSLGSIVLVTLWLVYAIVLVVVELFRKDQVDTNTILGAIVAYVLAAVAFSSVFELIEFAQPGSFSGLPADGVSGLGCSERLRMHSSTSVSSASRPWGTGISFQFRRSLDRRRRSKAFSGRSISRS